MPDRLSPFEVLAADVRPFTPAAPDTVFAALRRTRQAKPGKGAPLYYVHASSSECVSALLSKAPPGGLVAADLPGVVVELLARPPLSADRGPAHSRVGIFARPGSGAAFVVHLRAQALPAAAGAPSAFVSASLDAEPLDLSDPVGLQLGCLFIEAALADVNLPPGPTIDVWVWHDATDDERRRVQTLTRLEGGDAVFRVDLENGRGGIATLPVGARRVFVVDGADDASVHRWRGASVPVVDVAADDCLGPVRDGLCDAVFDRLRSAVAAVRTPATAAPATRPPQAATEGKPAPWKWTDHARERAAERGIPTALVDEHVVKPARDSWPKDANRDPAAAAEGRTVVVGQCPPNDAMPDGGKLYRGVIPGKDGGRVVILAVGWKPQPDGSRNIHTLYDPAAHPDSWNADFTRGTPAGAAAGDFPRGTKWALQ